MIRTSWCASWSSDLWKTHKDLLTVSWHEKLYSTVQKSVCCLQHVWPQLTYWLYVDMYSRPEQVKIKSNIHSKHAIQTLLFWNGKPEAIILYTTVLFAKSSKMHKVQWSQSYFKKFTNYWISSPRMSVETFCEMRDLNSYTCLKTEWNLSKHNNSKAQHELCERNRIMFKYTTVHTSLQNTNYMINN